MIEELSQTTEGLETVIRNLGTSAHSLDMNQLTLTYPREQVSKHHYFNIALFFRDKVGRNRHRDELVQSCHECLAINTQYLLEEHKCFNLVSLFLSL